MPTPFSFSHIKRLARGRIPGQVVVQFTDRCNASCAQCGMRVANRFERSTLSLDTVKRLVDAMAARGVTALSFTGGEPLMCLDEVCEGLSYAGRAGISHLRTGTNGFIFKGADKPDYEDKIKRIADQLAATPISTFWVSVDSASPEAHEKNRGLPGVVAGIEKALPIFHERGLYPSANLGVNRLTGGEGQIPRGADPWDPEAFYGAFRQAFRKFYSFVEGLGFTIVNACYPMSFEDDEGAVYAATSLDDFISFRPEEKLQAFRALYDTIPEYRSRLRIFSPRSSLYALMREYGGEEAFGYPCMGGVDFFFIDAAKADTYPCGYRGRDNLGKFWDLDLDSMEQPWCRQCDWECFRDPSELIGPLQYALRAPVATARKLLGNPEYRRAWLGDVRYYRACGFFDGRRPPDMRALSRFTG